MAQLLTSKRRGTTSTSAQQDKGSMQHTLKSFFKNS